jgi:hypothetical protein
MGKRQGRPAELCVSQVGTLSDDARVYCDGNEDVVKSSCFGMFEVIETRVIFHL